MSHSSHLPTYNSSWFIKRTASPFCEEEKVVSASEGSRAVVAALLANLGIAASKITAFIFTGSSSMLSEGMHSIADSGNQVLLLIGRKQALKGATAEHPFGYGRARYVYAFTVSIVLFSLGGVFALYEGWHKITYPEELINPAWALCVLVVAVILEAFSLRTAVKESNHLRGGASWNRFVRGAKAPELPVILMEDVGALIGLLFALIGVTAAVITGDARWDGIGSVAIGILLVAIAVFLAIEMNSLLIGESGTAEHVAAIRRALEGANDVHRIIHLKTLHLGPDELMVVAKISVRHDETAASIARAIDAAESRIRSAVPIARVIYLEPDIFHPPES
jgi:cation diffusion facilitator family transporter